MGPHSLIDLLCVICPVAKSTIEAAPCILGPSHSFVDQRWCDERITGPSTIGLGDVVGAQLASSRINPQMQFEVLHLARIPSVGPGLVPTLSLGDTHSGRVDDHYHFGGACGCR